MAIRVSGYGMALQMGRLHTGFRRKKDNPAPSLRQRMSVRPGAEQLRPSGLSFGLASRYVSCPSLVGGTPPDTEGLER